MNRATLYPARRFEAGIALMFLERARSPPCQPLEGRERQEGVLNAGAFQLNRPFVLPLSEFGYRLRPRQIGWVLQGLVVHAVSYVVTMHASDSRRESLHEIGQVVPHQAPVATIETDRSVELVHQLGHPFEVKEQILLAENSGVDMFTKLSGAEGPIRLNVSVDWAFF